MNENLHNPNDAQMAPKSKSKVNTKTVDFIPDYYVYTDGSCSNNGRKNASAGIGIFFGDDDIRNVSKKVEGKQTNNTAELTAIIETYAIIENDLQCNGKRVAIVSDSEYAIRCVSSYGAKCAKTNWKSEMPNKEMVKMGYELYKDQSNVQFIHIMAHTNNTDIHSIGNDNADRLANMAVGLDTCPYNDTIPKATAKLRQKPTPKPKPKHIIDSGMSAVAVAAYITENDTNTEPRVYLEVPFMQKDKVKKLGGRWDCEKKKWYVYDSNKNMNKILISFSKILDENAADEL